MLPATARPRRGILGLTRSVAAEVIADGIHVNAMRRDSLTTPMMQAIPEEEMKRNVALVPQQRVGTPEEVAGLALLLASADGGYMVGQTLSPNGGLWM